jgi:hypothetical protein
MLTRLIEKIDLWLDYHVDIVFGCVIIVEIAAVLLTAWGISR